MLAVVALPLSKLRMKIHEARRVLWRNYMEIKVERSGGRKMLRGMVVALMLVGLSSSADAVEAFKDYRAMKNGGKKALTEVYLAGVIDGLMGLNAAMRKSGQQALYCLPHNFALTVEQADDILTRSAEKLEKGMDISDFPVSLLLIDGLEDTFPCQH
jgi:hypothetical protein